jgi:hypothetical protein
MPSSLFAAASALFLAGGYLSFGEATRSRAMRLMAGRRGEDRVSAILSAAADRIDSILVESKPGRVAQIDHVVRGQSSLVVVETKNWNGEISGGVNDREWHQRRPDGSLAVLRNPVMQAKRQARILREATGAQCGWLVVMAGRSRAPDGMEFPAGVVFPENLAEALYPMISAEGTQTQPVEAVAGAWERLLAQASVPGAAKAIQRQGDAIEARYGKREWMGWIAMAIAAGALGWMQASTSLH